jgi:hypothetical protein
LAIHKFASHVKLSSRWIIESYNAAILEGGNEGIKIVWAIAKARLNTAFLFAMVQISGGQQLGLLGFKGIW